MTGQLNRAARRRLDRRAKQLFARIDELQARCELIQLACEFCGKFSCRGKLAGGVEFAVCFSPEGITWGEMEPDGFCSFEVYGQDGEHLWGYGGDGYDLEEEVCK